MTWAFSFSSVHPNKKKSYLTFRFFLSLILLQFLYTVFFHLLLPHSLMSCSRFSSFPHIASFHYYLINQCSLSSPYYLNWSAILLYVSKRNHFHSPSFMFHSPLHYWIQYSCHNIVPSTCLLLHSSTPQYFRRLPRVLTMNWRQRWTWDSIKWKQSVLYVILH